MKSQFGKAFLGVFAGAALLFSASPALAAQLNASQINSILQLLQSFNVDSATLNNVENILSGGQVISSPPASPSSCPGLSFNLVQGNTDGNTNGQVSQLQQFLGIPPVGIYGPQTRARVAALQTQNGVLATGGVGPITRALIARLCGGTTAPIPTPVPPVSTFNFNVPFSVAVGQTALESQFQQLTVQVLSINAATAQVTLGENCQIGTQCFYHPTKTATMVFNQPVAFQSYLVTLTAVSNGVAIFTASKNTPPSSSPVGITSITPSQALVGSQVTISGVGFTNDNTIRFGIGGQQHIVSSTGTTLTFTIPQSIGPCDLITPGQQVCATFLQLVQPGVYDIFVANANGQSTSVPFTVTGQPQGSSISLTQPTAGQVFIRGAALPIAWTSTSAVPASASVILDLYTEVGVKIGTIAISSISSGLYNWGIPGFPQNYMCTQQFPNGLCGVSIPSGRYYVQAIATSDGFNPTSAIIYATTQSGLFTINQQ